MHTQLFFISAVLAILPRAFAYVYSTQSLCITAYDTKSHASVKSTSIALTVPLTFTNKYTSTPTTTITPAPVSTTVTTTSTITTVISTAATTTFFTTTTSTSTFLTTITQTITGTTTVTTGTVTIPTAPGFTPIVSGFQYQPKKRSVPLAIERRPVRRGASSSSTACRLPVPISTHTTFSPPVYPTAVTCGYLVEAITTTTKTVPATTTAKTTIAPSTTTRTSTASTTVTSIATVPSVSTTITISAPPTTTSSTVTSSTTTTVTVVAPLATFYAACAPNNIVNSANGGNGIPFINYADGLISTADTTAYDCCVSCQTGVACNGYAFLSNTGSSTPMCYYFSDGVSCNGGTEGLAVFESQQDYPPADGYTIGDGPCGQVGDVGNAEAGHFPDPPDLPFGY